MQFKDYIKDVEKSLSEVKLKILKTLWESGTGFPRLGEKLAPVGKNKAKIL